MDKSELKYIKDLLDAAYATYKKDLETAENYLNKTGPRIVEPVAEKSRMFGGMFESKAPERSRPTEATMSGYKSMLNNAHELFAKTLREIATRAESGKVDNTPLLFYPNGPQ
jgi:hypothetical protein